MFPFQLNAARICGILANCLLALTFAGCGGNSRLESREFTALSPDAVTSSAPTPDFASAFTGISAAAFVGSYSLLPQDIVTFEPFTNQWTLVKPRTGAGGTTMARLDGVLYSFKYGNSYGWMESHDDGETWAMRYGVMPPQTMTKFAGRLVIAGTSFRYASSADGGASWTPTARFPGLDSSWDLSVNSADCFFTIAGKLYAKSFVSELPTWISTDGVVFRLATTEEAGELAVAMNENNWSCGGYGGVWPTEMRNLLYDEYAIGSRYFRQTYAPPDPPDPNKYWDYFLEVSSDKLNWQKVTVTQNWSTNWVSEVKPGRFIALGNRTINDSLGLYAMDTYLSTDAGATWRSVGKAPLIPQTFNAVATSRNVVIAVGADGALSRSTDGGEKWSDIDSRTHVALTSVATDGSSTFIAVGSSGTILRSADSGVTWSSIASGTTSDLKSVAYGSGRFLVVQSSGQILSSTNGTAWAPLGNGLTQYAPLTYGPVISYGDGAFVVVSPENVCVGSNCSTGNPGVFYSLDLGASWQASSGAFSGHTIAYGAGRFLLQSVAGSQAKYFSSKDKGKTWQPVGASATVLSGGIAFGRGVFAAAGYTKDPSGGNGIFYGVEASADGGETWRFFPIYCRPGERLSYTGSRWVGFGQQTLAVSPR